MRYLLLSLALCACVDTTAPAPVPTDCYVVNTVTHVSDYYPVCPIAPK